MRNAGKLLIVAMALVSSSAWAGPLALWVGQTTFLGFPGSKAQVEVSDPSVVEARALKGGAELRAKFPGVTKVTLRLRGGETYEFAVHVTPSGAEVYSTSRNESEHSGFSLPSPTQGKESKRSAVASKPQKDTSGKETARTARRDTKAQGPRS